MDEAELDHRFTYHAPPDSDTVAMYQNIRRYARSLAEMIDDSQQESREKSLAITKLEEVVMWANAGIARNGIRKPRKGCSPCDKL